MWLIVFPLIFGYFLAVRKPGFVRSFPVNLIINVSLVLLLFVMGARIGIDEEIIAQIIELGSFALFVSIFAILGSVLFLLIIDLLKTGHLQLQRDNQKNTKNLTDNTASSDNQDHEIETLTPVNTILSENQQQDSQDTEMNRFSFTLMLTGSVLVGVIAGIFILPVFLLPWLTEATSWILGLLLLGVGLDLGLSNTIIKEFKKYGLAVLLLPFGVALGSIVGAIIYSLFSGSLYWNEAAALASGFGWYSLSAVIISEVHTPTLGATAFLTNIFRELIAILIIPMVAKYLGGIAAIAPGGATSMDVTLPIIAKGAGKEYVPLAFFSGAILSLMVPIMVNFFLSL